MLKYLALGDSYTIGEAVSENDSFPFQLTKHLNQVNIFINNPTVIAKTGWTTDELNDAIAAADLQPPYDIVTLLIGVNNQYRGRDLDNFKEEFILLLTQAIAFANGDKNHVFVLSIPDWSVTPFGKESGRDLQKIASEIDQFNNIVETECLSQNVSYTNITPISRKALYNLNLNASDGLHPSTEMYKEWVEQLSQKIIPIVVKSQ